MSSMHRSSVIRRLASGAALAAAIAGCNRSTAEADKTPAETPVVSLRADNVAVATEREISSGPSISGTLIAQKQATLRAEVAGAVVQVFVEQGQAVRAGQALLKLDDGAIREAELSAKSQARTANEALVVAKRNAERSERLAQAGALAERDLEQARSTVLNAEAALADAGSRLTNATKQVDKTTIRAPFSGVVSERQANAGDVMQMGNPAVSIVDPASLRLEATVPVSALAVLKIGTEVDFGVSGYEGKSFTGRVERINPAVDPATRQVRIYVGIPNSAGRLVAGLFAQGRVSTEQRRALAVPLTGIDLKGTAPMVRRLRGGRVELVAVELGMQDDVLQMVEILKGLAPGDTVLIGPGAGVAVGTPVRITKE